jgi:hypothetical protein
MRNRKGTGRWEGLQPGGHSIVVCGRCWGEQMAGQWPELGRDVWFRIKPGHRSEAVMSPEPCARCGVLGARHGSCDLLTAARTRIHAVHRSRLSRDPQQGITEPVRR